ncbi:gamma-glutamyltransferase [Holophaga foetida]|uniref:gamma-glutamyltransferase n=1 Tax=Holophaga foetida TaxID=35839 RepID=UPI000247177A|nr:gamma-glutamyltransferase [Holophaga foetida]
MSTKYSDFRVATSSVGPRNLSVAQGKGAVASVSKDASALAIAVLEDGGNAFDAAFAMAFSLAVFHPQAGNIGGGGYLVYKEKGNAPRVYNYREQAPRGAKREDYLQADGNPDPDRTAFGPASVCAPGTVKAFFMLQQRHGRLKASDLLLAIARQAREGAVVTQYECECLNRLAPKLAVSPESKRNYVKAEPWKAGELIYNPNLAQTLETLAREGADAFYRGRIAEQILEDLSRNGGLLAWEDLAGYEVREQAPISLEVGGRQVWTVPPEGGGAMVLEILNILDQPGFRALPWGSPAYHHHVVQAWKMAFLHRGDYLGDIPLADNAVYRGLLERESGHRLFSLINPRRDTPSGELAALMGDGTSQEGPNGKNTTHFAVVDAEGNAVSNSYTMNLRYGSKWSVEGAGFLLNGSIDSFSFAEGKENYFGVVGSRPNLFAPGKRPASNMAPLMVTVGDAVESVLGTPGGPTIPTTMGEVLAATLLHGVDPREVLGLSRMHHQAWPDKLSHEPNFDRPDLLKALEDLGYTVKDKNELISDVHGVYLASDGYLAISDYRREGVALAY